MERELSQRLERIENKLDAFVHGVAEVKMNTALNAQAVAECRHDHKTNDARVDRLALVVEKNASRIAWWSGAAAALGAAGGYLVKLL